MRALFLGLVLLMALPAGPAEANPRRTKRHSRARRGLSTERIAAYRAAVARWQAVPTGVRATWQDGMRDVTFYSVKTHERASVRLFRSDGTLDPGAAGEVRRVARDRRTNAEHDLDPRLLTLLYRLAVELDAPQISLVSGFRSPRPRSHSHHSEGRAVDLIVPGVDPERVAEIARRFGHVGVGSYPTSGFVHLDVRNRSYFWIDHSGPGQRGRVQQVRREESRAADAAFDPEAERIRPRQAPVATERRRPGRRWRRQRINPR